RRFANITDVPARFLRLIYDGRIIIDEDTPQSLEMENDNLIEVHYPQSDSDYDAYLAEVAAREVDAAAAAAEAAGRPAYGALAEALAESDNDHAEPIAPRHRAFWHHATNAA
ncbi:hypothetical protein PENTCL1PPCAC_24308, partial [Pristionchus entomophagus]